MRAASSSRAQGLFMSGGQGVGGSTYLTALAGLGEEKKRQKAPFREVEIFLMKKEKVRLVLSDAGTSKPGQALAGSRVTAPWKQARWPRGPRRSKAGHCNSFVP